MSVVILGGNECMERRYKELCQTYRCQAKVFTKPAGGPAEQAGQPRPDDFFHRHHVPQDGAGALSQLKGQNTIIERCHTSSLSALRGILEKHAG